MPGVTASTLTPLGTKQHSMWARVCACVCVHARVCVPGVYLSLLRSRKPCNYSTVCGKATEFYLCILAPPLRQPTWYAQQRSPPWEEFTKSGFSKPRTNLQVQTPFDGLSLAWSLPPAPLLSAWLTLPRLLALFQLLKLGQAALTACITGLHSIF